MATIDLSLALAMTVETAARPRTTGVRRHREARRPRLPHALLLALRAPRTRAMFLQFKNIAGEDGPCRRAKRVGSAGGQWQQT